MEEPRTTLPAGEPEPNPRAMRRELRYEGRIALHERLGAGGMGEVLLGTDEALGRQVAVKLARGVGDTEARRRFVAEARITGRLAHPGVVPVHLLSETEDGEPYFAMKRIEGEDLAHRLERIEREEGGVDPRRRLELLEVFLKVCDALAYAHSRGVVHRDIKPANVMVGDFGEVLVVDWGLARVGVAELPGGAPRTGAPPPDEDPVGTLDGTVMGTPAYMSPEQARGAVHLVAATSDQYALGALLYQLLTLRPPFVGGVADILDRVIAGDIRPPSAVVPWEVPWELEAVVLRAMATLPERRYPSVDELARDVRRFLEGRSLGAIRYSPRQLLTRWLWRHRALAGALAVAALATLATAGGAYLRVAREAERTRAALVREGGERARAELALAQAADARDREQSQRREVERQLATALGYKAAIAIAGRQDLAAAVYQAHARALDDSPSAAYLALRLRRPSALLRLRLTGCVLSQLRDGRWARLEGRQLALDSPDLTPGPARDLGGEPGLIAVAADGTWRAELDGERGLRVVSANGVRVLAGAPSQPSSLVVSPDGRWIAASDGGTQLMLWSVDEPAAPKVFPALARHNTAVAFAADSGRLFGAWSDGSVTVSALAGAALASEEVRRLRAPRPVTALAPSPDGRMLATGLLDGSVQLWDLESGRPAPEMRGHASEVRLLAYCPDGRWLASADREGEVRLWNPSAGELVQTLNAPRHPWSLIFAADRGRVLCSNATQTWCWELPAFPPVSARHILAAHGQGRWGFVHALAVDPRGRWCASSGDYRTVKVWDLETGALVRAGWRQLYEVTSLAPSPDGERLLVGTADGVVALHALDREEPAWLSEGTAAVYDLAFSPDGRRVASIDADGILTLRDSGDGRLVARIPQPAGCRGLCFSPDGRWVATPAGTWDAASAAPALRFEVDPRPLDSTMRTPLAYDKSGRWLAIGRGARIELRDARGGARLHLLEGHGGHVQSLAFAPTVPLLVSGSVDGTVRGWDGATGERAGDAIVLLRWALRLAFIGERELLVACGFGAVERLGRDAPADLATAEGLAGLRRAGSVLVDGPPNARLIPAPPWPPSGSPDADLFEQAVGHRQGGHAAEAIALLDRAIALDPGLAIAYLERGTLRLGANQLAAALPDLERALLLAEEQGRARLARRSMLVLATTSHLLGDLDGARARYGKLVARAAAAPIMLRRARLGLALCEPTPVDRDRGLLAVLEEDGADTPPLFCEAVSTPIDTSLADLMVARFADHPLAHVEHGLYQARLGKTLVAQEHFAQARELSRPGAPFARWRELVERRVQGR